MVHPAGIEHAREAQSYTSVLTTAPHPTGNERAVQGYNSVLTTPGDPPAGLGSANGGAAVLDFEAHDDHDLSLGDDLLKIQDARARRSQGSPVAGNLVADTAAPDAGAATATASHHTNMWDHEYTLATNTQAAGSDAAATSAVGAASTPSQGADDIFAVRPDRAAGSQSPPLQGGRDRKPSKGNKRARARADVQAEHEPSQGAGFLTINPLFAGGTNSAGVDADTAGSCDQGGASTPYRPRTGSITLGGFDADETTMEM